MTESQLLRTALATPNIYPLSRCNVAQKKRQEKEEKITYVDVAKDNLSMGLLDANSPPKTRDSYSGQIAPNNCKCIRSVTHHHLDLSK